MLHTTLTISHLHIDKASLAQHFGRQERLGLEARAASGALASPADAKKPESYA